MEKRLNITISDEINDFLDKEVVRTGCTKGDVIRFAVIEYARTRTKEVMSEELAENVKTLLRELIV